MRVTTSPAPLALLLLVAACASGEMNRSSSEGDSVGESGGDSDDDDSASTDAPTTDPADSTSAESDDGASESPVDPSDTDPSDTDPGTTGASATDPSETDPSETDPSDSSGTDPSDTDPTDTDPTDTDPSESSGEGGSTDDGGMTDTDAPGEVDLSGYILIQTASAREFVIPDGTVVPLGGFLVIGRNASPGTFQDFWGVNWGDGVVYLEGLDSFPTINGDETYSLLDPAEDIIDGPTVALEIATSMARTNANLSGGDADGWEVAPSPNDTAVPGTSAAIGGTSGVPYISECADTTGAGNYDYEFVEIHVPA